jgi:hypothetical protein
MDMQLRSFVVLTWMAAPPSCHVALSSARVVPLAAGGGKGGVPPPTDRIRGRRAGAHPPDPVI